MRAGCALGCLGSLGVLEGLEIAAWAYVQAQKERALGSSPRQCGALWRVERRRNPPTARPAAISDDLLAPAAGADVSTTVITVLRHLTQFLEDAAEEVFILLM